ncbi:MAG: division/cell wall cluster transcriptional repressor MraZ [Christensenellales bacterium]|jgi:MraZ protein|nr:division/cell wall cluster transcriptional repressor MraZ [Clostridiales bacterium]
MTVIFFGEYFIQLDDKNRMRIPSKLRSLIGEKFYISNGTAGCLFVMDKENFEDYAQKLASITSMSNLSQQNTIRLIMSSVDEPCEDSQGRFVLPPKLRKHAGITKKMVFIGVNNRMEIWSEERYNAMMEKEASNFDEAFASLEKI